MTGVSVTVHKTIDDAHGSHGVSTKDFKQYREYCTRKLFRLRHAKDVRQEFVHSSVYVAGEKTRKNAYCPRDIESSSSPGTSLLVLLFEAERCWSHGNELKDSGLDTARTRQHALRKLRKAKTLADRLVSMSKQHGDEKTQLEASAYGGWMNGNYAFEVGDWKVWQ